MSSSIQTSQITPEVRIQSRLDTTLLKLGPSIF